MREQPSPSDRGPGTPGRRLLLAAAVGLTALWALAASAWLYQPTDDEDAERRALRLSYELSESFSAPDFLATKVPCGGGVDDDLSYGGVDMCAARVLPTAPLQSTTAP